MSDLRLSSSTGLPIENLVGSALEQKARSLRAGIEISRRRIEEFEKRFATSSEEFLRLYMNDEWEETDDSTDWIGEMRMLERLSTKLATLQGITIEN